MASGQAVRERRLRPEGPPRLKILLVDEESENLLSQEAALQSLGQEIVSATSLEEANHYLQEEDFAVILLDVKMAAKDGTAASIREHERARDTPIIVLTSVKDEQDLLKTLHAGAVDYLQTPFSPEVLRSKVSVFVHLSLKTEMLRRKAKMLQIRNAELEQLAAERQLVEKQILALNAELENHVRARTGDLSRSNDELRQFAYASSHDLKEPMRTIASYTQLLNQRYADRLDGDGREFLNYVIDAVRRMDALLTDLLTYSQHLGTKSAAAHLVNAEAVLTGVFMNLRASIVEAQALITHDPLPPDVLCEFAQLGQVLQNLISNALKYRKPGIAPAIHISAADFDGEWRFSVEDNGTGIESKYVEQVFGIFKRLHGREYSGTGMGLAICKKIVERHGGRIWVESDGQTGSTFYFTIPK